MEKYIEDIMQGSLRGAVSDVPNDIYHSSPGVSKTALDQINKSPAHYQEWLKNPPQSTPSMLFGSLCHAAVLEPKTFKDRYVAAPEGMRRGTKAWKEFESEHAGKDIIKPDDFTTLTRISEAVWSNKTAQKALNGRREVSVYSDLEASTGKSVPVKCRPDVWAENGYLVDLKFVADNSKDAFAASAARYRYDVQAAFYFDVVASLGEAPKGFVFMAVEKTAPFTVAYYVWDDVSLAKGRQRYQENLNLWWTCKSEDKWPGPDNGIETISLPAWNVEVE